MPSFVNGVRSEFTVSDIEYSRDGGWFLTYRKAALLTIFVMGLCLFSAYMGRAASDQIVYVQHQNPSETPSPDEDEVINEIIFVAEDGVKHEIKTVEDSHLSKFTKLHQEVSPLHYDLHFVFNENPKHHTFKVMANVTLQPLVDHLDEIVMHAKSLEFDEVKMIEDHQENKSIKVTLEEFDPHAETIKLKLDQTISRNEKYKLMFHITGNIGDSTGAGGVFRSMFTEDKNTRHVLMTKFDPTGARQAFPCFDEPFHKTTFNVSVTHSKSYSCLSNTARSRNVTDSKHSSMTVTTFEPTPRMSTHLLSFFIGNVTSKSVNITVPHHKHPVSLHILGRAAMTEHFVFMTEFVPEIVQHFYALFDTPLPLTKIDLVVLPNLNVSVLENWGLIFLGESDCQVDELSTFEQKLALYILVGHNLAHHWLGDLVTLKNWTSIWFYEALAISSVDDSLNKTDLSKMWPNGDIKFVRRKSFALHADSVYDTRSIQNVSEESIASTDLYGSLDSLIYSKGVFVLDMLKSTLSEQSYKKGVQSFLKSWDLSNADEFDFAETLNGVLEKPLVWASNNTRRNITHVLRNWMDNVGFPVVHVTRDERKRDMMKFRQERFHYELPKDTSFDEDTEDQLWYIPITLTTRTNTNFSDLPRFWLDMSEHRYRVPGLDEGDWIVVNLNLAGLYRVNYDLNIWSLLTREIQRGLSSSLPSLTQAQLMDDAFALARSGMLSYEIPLNMSKALKDNATYVTWMTMLNNVRFFKNVLIHEKHSVIEDFLIKIMSGVYEFLSYEMALSYREELLLAEVAEWSCRLSMPACVANAKKTYQENGYELIKVMNTDQTISTTLCTVVRESVDEWSVLWRALNQTDDKYPELLQALTCSKNLTKIHEIFDRLLTECSNPKLTKLWIQLSSDPDTSIQLFNWFRSNWERIKDETKDAGQDVLGKIVTGCIQGLTTSTHLAQLKKFLQTHEDDHMLTLLEPVITSCIKTIELKISWRTKNSYLVNKWLRAYVESH
uniref:Thyrotropin-releasing hormone-degrading ectoenzyme n=1 Tax=Cacopsylla melanoneura TaxID=428564 RepID=A0A8D8VV21_9HEMI